MVGYIGDWEASLALGVEDEHLRLHRQHGCTGRPLDSLPFILQLEKTLGPNLRKYKLAPKGHGIPRIKYCVPKIVSPKLPKMWNHQNLSMQEWRRKVILHDTSAAVDAAGFDAFAIFDVNEELLAQGA